MVTVMAQLHMRFKDSKGVILQILGKAILSCKIHDMEKCLVVALDEVVFQI